MADGLVKLIAIRGEERIPLFKGEGKAWSRNMDIDNPFYRRHIRGNVLDGLIKILKTRGCRIFTVPIACYCSNKNFIMVDSNIYLGLSDNEPRVCFSRDKTGVTKLLCSRAKLPVEFAQIGHNTSNQCIVPAIFYMDNDSYIGVNI